MKLSSKLSLISLLACAAFQANASSLGDAPLVNKNPGAALDYWTPERLKSAKPMDLPTVDAKQLQQIKLQYDGPSFSTEAAPPAINITPDTAKLYDSDGLTSQNGPLKNVGTRGLHFSSSRLVPLTADLSYPYTAVGKLFFSIPGGGNAVCSASVIGNRLVVTAGHCVHNGSNAFFTNFVFVPAFRDNTAPLQRWEWAFVDAAPAWKTGGGGVPNAGDFAIIEMKDNVVSGVTRRVGDVTGKLGVATNKLAANHLHMLGYPCNHDSCAKMHQVTAQNGPAVAPNNVMYGSDMRGGSSGGPWVQNFGAPAVGQTGGLNPGLNQVVAVTSWGFTATDPLVQGAANFNGAFTTLFNQLCAHRAGNC